MSAETTLKIRTVDGQEREVTGFYREIEGWGAFFFHTRVTEDGRKVYCITEPRTGYWQAIGRTASEAKQMALIHMETLGHEYYESSIQKILAKDPSMAKRQARVPLAFKESEPKSKRGLGL